MSYSAARVTALDDRLCVTYFRGRGGQWVEAGLVTVMPATSSPEPLGEACLGALERGREVRWWQPFPRDTDVTSAALGVHSSVVDERASSVSLRGQNDEVRVYLMRRSEGGALSDNAYTRVLKKPNAIDLGTAVLELLELLRQG
jgi:hypothetical protein